MFSPDFYIPPMFGFYYFVLTFRIIYCSLFSRSSLNHILIDSVAHNIGLTGETSSARTQIHKSLALNVHWARVQRTSGFHKFAIVILYVFNFSTRTSQLLTRINISEQLNWISSVFSFLDGGWRYSETIGIYETLNFCKNKNNVSSHV